MDEKLKSENMQKEQFSEWGGGEVIRVMTGWSSYADHTFIQIYFRMHNFVVKFSKCFSPQAARRH